MTELEEAITTLKGLEPGMKAPEFTLNDPKGNPVTLSSVYSQNKITMIDFGQVGVALAAVLILL